MGAVNALAKKAASHQRLDSLSPALRPALRWPATPSATASYEHRPSAESSSAGTSWAPGAARRETPPRDHRAHVSECAVCFRASGTPVTGLRESHPWGSEFGPSRLFRSSELRRRRPSPSWPEAAPAFGGSSLFRLVDLVLAIAVAIQANLLEGAPPAALALACLARHALLSFPGARPSAGCRRSATGCGRAAGAGLARFAEISPEG